MEKKITFLYICLLASLLAVNVVASARKAVDSLYYCMKIDTLGIDVGYLRIDSVYDYKLTVDNAKGEHAFWRFVTYHTADNTPVPDHYWIINYKTQDTLKFKAPVSRYDTVAHIDKNGNLFCWEQLFLNESSGKDSLVSSYQEYIDDKGEQYVITNSFFLTLTGEGEVLLLDRRVASRYPKIRFQIERASIRPDESKYYRIKMDTLGIPLSESLGYLALDSIVNMDSVVVDSAKSFYSAWKFVTDTIVGDTTYYRIYNKSGDNLLSFDVPENDTVAVLSGTGDLKSWLIPFFLEDNGIGKFMVRDTSTHQDYYLGLKDSTVMLVSDTVAVKVITFALEDEFPPVVDPFDSTQIYKVKKLSGEAIGKYVAMANVGTTPIYIDSVYAHLPDGQFVVNKLNTNSLINRNVASSVTDTFKFVINDTGDTIPDVFVCGGDTVEVQAIHYGSLDASDSLLGYKYFPATDLKQDSCFYLQYVLTDSLEGRILGAGVTVTLLAPGDTARYFIEYDRTEYATAAPAGIAALQRHIYKLRSQQDTMLYLAVNSPLEMTSQRGNEGRFIFKEGEMKGGYSLVIANNNAPPDRKFIVDSVSKELSLHSLENSKSSLFRFVKTEIPVYPDDEFQYLRALQKGWYEVRSTIFTSEEKMLTKNFNDYAVFSREGESVLKAGSYLPNDFCLWLDTARGAGSNRFRTSVYIIKDAIDTIGFNMQGYFLHVNDSTMFSTEGYYYQNASGKKYSMANFVRAKRTASNNLLLLGAPSLIGEGTLLPDAIKEYRFYLQKTETDETKYHIVTEKGYGGYRDSTGYLSYSSADDKYYFGPREGTAKLIVRLVKSSPVANEVVRPYVPEEIIQKEIMVIGGMGEVSILNAMGKRVRIYNIVGQEIVNKTAVSDNEKITVSRGIAIVKIDSNTRKALVK
ncbi:MAG: DUF6383 domain-containing protein [Tannerella sp.]|jgi:hypothetical protein|nr:DUF6383 domain-containing protein [Tannerella sp.]